MSPFTLSIDPVLMNFWISVLPVEYLMLSIMQAFLTLTFFSYVNLRRAMRVSDDILVY